MEDKTNYPFGNQFIIGIRNSSFFANVVGVDGCVYCVLRILRTRNLCGSVTYLLMRITYLLDISIINGDFCIRQNYGVYLCNFLVIAKTNLISCQVNLM